MKAKRILAALCAVAMFAVLTTGCSKANQADTDAVNAAMDKFRACTSFTVIQTTEGYETVTIDGEKQEASGITEMEITLVTAPEAQMKTGTSIKLSYDGEVMEQTTASYLVPENGGYVEYVTNGTEWIKVSSEDGNALDGYNADFVMGTFCADKVAFGKAGEETLESGKATRYEGKLAGEELVAMLEANGHLNSVSSMSDNQQSKIRTNLVKDLDGVTVCVWVDEASGYPVRFELDMTDTLKDMEKSISKTLGNKSSGSDWSITKYVISMTAKDFNALDEIVLPPEAASAVPYEVEDTTAT